MVSLDVSFVQRVQATLEARWYQLLRWGWYRYRDVAIVWLRLWRSPRVVTWRDWTMAKIKVVLPFIPRPVRAWFGRLFRRRASSRRYQGKKFGWYRFWQWASIAGFASVIVGIIVFFGLFAWYSRELPKPGQIIRREGFSTKFYDREGELLYDLFQTERRTPVDISEIPEVVKQATIAIEDKDFYKHKGLDLLTVIRIPYNFIIRGRVVGGSTLSQQLVKNVLLTNERTLIRKFKEFVLALQIERTFTKDQILEMYLNEVPYGGTAAGVAAASEIYFDKPIADISLEEAAILAGLPQRPSAYSPFSARTTDDGELLWKWRTQGVLRRMLEDGYITQERHDEAVANLDSIEFAENVTDIRAPHFVFYVRDQLEEMFGEDIVERGGLKITTTLDWELQDQAQEIVTTEVEEVEDFDISNGAAMAMDPQTGEILAMVGSRDYFNSEIGGQFNVVVDGLRQPGSSIKPITYLSMFELGFNPATVLADVATEFAPHSEADVYEPQNYDGQYRGPVTLRQSLGSSLNIPAVKSLAIVGILPFLEQAYNMGFPTLAPTPENMQRFGLAVTLGGAEVHMIDTVTAYSAFANGGRKVQPVSILRVETLDGDTLYEHRQVSGAQVISEESAFLINDILSDNNARLLAFGANSLLNTGRPIAVKTGTTNDQRDNWTIGWSQNIIVGSWVGNNDNSPMTRVASGVTGASPIWRNIITEALRQGYTAPEWEVPEGIEQVTLDSISGYPPHDDFATKTEYVIKGTVPPLPDPIHAKLKVCKGENKLANEARVGVGDYDTKEYVVLKEDDPFSQDGVNRWQDGIDAWIESQENELYKFPREYCGDAEEVSVNLSDPDDKENFDSTEIRVRAEAGSGSGIDKIEIFVNGSVKETVSSSRFESTLNLSKGKYEIYAKAFSRDGKSATSNRVRIGTGGEKWDEEDEPDSTPTPKPTATPSPTPTPSPTATPVVDIDV